MSDPNPAVLHKRVSGTPLTCSLGLHDEQCSLEFDRHNPMGKVGCTPYQSASLGLRDEQCSLETDTHKRMGEVRCTRNQSASLGLHDEQCSLEIESHGRGEVYT